MYLAFCCFCDYVILSLFLESKAMNTIPETKMILQVFPGSQRGKMCFAHLKSWKQLFSLWIYSNHQFLICKILQMVLGIENCTKISEGVYFSELCMCFGHFLEGRFQLARLMLGIPFGQMYIPVLTFWLEHIPYVPTHQQVFVQQHLHARHCSMSLVFCNKQDFCCSCHFIDS